MTSNEQTQSDEETAVLLHVPSGTCGCGCGFAHKPGSTFVMGHDQRLMSFLIRAHRDGAEVTLNNGSGVIVASSPIKAGAQFLSSRGIDKLAGYLDRTPARKPRPAATKPTDDGLPPVGDPRWVQAADLGVAIKDLPPSDIALGAQIPVKVGRWTYEATVRGMSQAGKVTAVEYTNKSGNVVVTDRFTLV